MSLFRRLLRTLLVGERCETFIFRGIIITYSMEAETPVSVLVGISFKVKYVFAQAPRHNQPFLKYWNANDLLQNARGLSVGCMIVWKNSTAPISNLRNSRVFHWISYHLTCSLRICLFNHLLNFFPRQSKDLIGLL